MNINNVLSLLLYWFIVNVNQAILATETHLPYVHGPISLKLSLHSLFNYCESLCILEVHPELACDSFFFNLESLKDGHSGIKLTSSFQNQ